MPKFKVSFVLLLSICLIEGVSPEQRTSCSDANGPKSKKMIAMYLFVKTDVDQFFKNCKRWNVNTVFTNSIYWDDQEFIDKAKRHNIDIGLLFPVFFNQEYLEAHPDEYSITSKGNRAIRDWLHFGCASSEAFRKHQLELLKETLPKLKPSMVVFDFIRFFVRWEEVKMNAAFDDIEDGCYCDRCLANFEKEKNIKLEERSAKWIKANVLLQWTDWKCSVVEETVKEFGAVVRAYDKKLSLGIKTVPWLQQQFNGGIRSIAGQDLSRLKDDVDFVMPMTYSHLFSLPPSWITTMMKEVNSLTSKPVYATVQMEKVFPDQNEITVTEFAEMMKAGMENPSKGVVLFHYLNSKNNEEMGRLVKME